ncbi:MAG TPA: HAD family hydrolase [Anaerolineae bacterium]|nr:HAD family hydrolase [Anaerolineae bacterium]
MEHHIAAICFDFGDTLVDEATEVKNERQVTLQGDLIPGVDQMLRDLHSRGYRLAIVSDGPVGNVDNVLRSHGLLDLFEAFAISETVGVDKPNPLMFLHALDQLGIGAENYGRTVMVGNNLSRDVKGANEMGMVSVFLDWSPRYPKLPTDASEVPAHTIQMPLDLLPLVERLEENHHFREGQGDL